MLFKLIAFNGRYIHSCLALFYVRSALEQNLSVCQTQIVQYTLNDPYYTTLRQIASGEPDGLFISVYIWNSKYIQRLIHDLVKLLPDIPVILGGPQAKALSRNLSPSVLQHCTVVLGEIEGVDSSFYRDLGCNSLQQEYGCSKMSTFKSPYRQEDFAGPLKNRNIYYESSRGCPFGCTYCLSAAVKGLHHLPVSQVHKEIKDILRHNPKTIRFVDRTFNDLPERALDIWQFLAEQPGETLFHFEMAPDRFTEAMFRFLEQVAPGRFQFELGVQSTHPQTLDAINRKCDLDRLASNILRLVSFDTIRIHLDLILGLPYENREAYRHSFTDVFRLGPHYIQMGLLKILPDAPISKCIQEFGLIVCEDPPYEVLANRWLDKNELENLYWFGECVEAFYNNRFFRSFWGHLRKIEEDVFVFFETLLTLCRDRNFFNQAHTQEMLSSLLLEAIQTRPDRELLKELLIFDWLRCGHHFLPPHLENEPLGKHRKNLWQELPQNWGDIYDHKGRDEFFKQGVFMPFSGDLMQEVCLPGNTGPSYIRFQPEREETVFRLNRFMLIPAPDLKI